MPLLIGLQELIRSWRENEQDQPPRGWRGLIKRAAALGKEAPNGLLAPRSRLRSLSQRSPCAAPALRLGGSQRDTTCGTGGAGGRRPCVHAWGGCGLSEWPRSLLLAAGTTGSPEAGTRLVGGGNPRDSSRHPSVSLGSALPATTVTEGAEYSVAPILRTSTPSVGAFP